MVTTPQKFVSKKAPQIAGQTIYLLHFRSSSATCSGVKSEAYDFSVSGCSKPANLCKFLSKTSALRKPSSKSRVKRSRECLRATLKQHVYHATILQIQPRQDGTPKCFTGAKPNKTQCFDSSCSANGCSAERLRCLPQFCAFRSFTSPLQFQRRSSSENTL